MKFKFLRLFIALIFLFSFVFYTKAAVISIDNGNQKVVHVHRFVNLKKLLVKPNTRYIIQHNHKLRGEILKVGANVTLDFQGGSFEGGTLLLNDNVTITGNPVFYYECSNTRSDTEFIGYSNQGGDCVFRAPVIIKDNSNILIENARFIIKSVRESVKWHGAIICYGEKESNNIIIANCTFEGDKVAFYANVTDSEISHCKFIDIPFTAIAIETAYDHSPWRHPKDIRVMNNIVEQNLDAIGEAGNAMWCSGVENLTIDNNTFRVLQGIMLYCGDGNVSLKNIFVANNRITLLTGYDDSLKNMASIILMGKSYRFLSEIMPEQSVVINNNILKSEVIEGANAGDQDNVGISLLYASNVSIDNNEIDGFYLGIDACDHFRGCYYRVNNIRISNNTFKGITNTALNVDCEPQLMDIDNNVFFTLDRGEELMNKIDKIIKYTSGNEPNNIYIKDNKILKLYETKQ